MNLDKISLERFCNYDRTHKISYKPKEYTLHIYIYFKFRCRIPGGRVVFCMCICNVYTRRVCGICNQIYEYGGWIYMESIKKKVTALQALNWRAIACGALALPDCGAGAVGLHIHIQCKGYAEKICILPSGRGRYPLRRDRQNDPGIRQRLSGGGGRRGRNPPLHAHLFRPGPGAEFRHEPSLWRGIRGAGRRPAQGNRRGLCGI